MSTELIKEIDNLTHTISNLVNSYSTSDFSTEYRNLKLHRLIETQQSIDELKRVFLL